MFRHSSHRNYQQQQRSVHTEVWYVCMLHYSTAGPTVRYSRQQIVLAGSWQSAAASETAKCFWA